MLWWGVLLILVAACGNSAGQTSVHKASPAPALASKQILSFPDVGISDISSLDPAMVADTNSSLIMNMIYSGLVRSDANQDVVPDQATWDVSLNHLTYTFHLKPGIAFADGTPVTAQAYVYSLARALLPEVQSPLANLYEGVIVGAENVSKGKMRTLSGVRALDPQTLQITLTHPAPYFLDMLAHTIYFPLNSQVINMYGQSDWTNHVVGSGIGTGPFIIQSWEHNVEMTLTPNPFYYGARTRLTEVDVYFESNATTALETYRSGRYNFTWNIATDDQASAKALAGFKKSSLLETDALFFNVNMAPFDNALARQAFAYATDQVGLAHAVFADTVLPASTILPPGMPGYTANNGSIAYNQATARTLWQSVYPDSSAAPQLTFSYPNSEVTQEEARALQQMWQDALGIQVTLLAVEPGAYSDELAKHEVQLGFVQWGADFADPYDCLALNLLSSSPNNVGGWSNAIFDLDVTLAEQETGSARLTLYQEAEQIALEQVAWLPLDHEMDAAIIPSWVQGVSLNGNGLYFGDWSSVYLLQH